MPRGTRRTPAQRAIIFAGALAGMNLQEINALLASANFPADVPQTTLDSIRKTYVPRWQADWSTLRADINGPATWGEI